MTPIEPTSESGNAKIKSVTAAMRYAPERHLFSTVTTIGFSYLNFFNSCAMVVQVPTLPPPESISFSMWILL
jgi:hypothetical protein